MPIDGNTSITFGFILALFGGYMAIKGYQAQHDAKTLKLGKDQGILEQTLKTMKDTLNAIRDENESFQKDHREEHKKIDDKIIIEKDVLLLKNKQNRRKVESIQPCYGAFF